MDQDPIIRTIARLSVSPGDTVVLHAGLPLHAEQIDALYNRLHRSLPEGVKALVLDSRLNPLQVIALQPAPVDERFDWADFRAMADEPAVDTAIRALLENQDEDNAVCMVRAVVEAAGERLERLAAGHVKMPTSADEAAAMANLGIAWLTEHAPERLKQSQPGSVLAAARSAIKARDTYGWSVEADAALNGLRAVLAQDPQPAQDGANHSALIAHWLKLSEQSERDGFHAEAAAYRVCADQLGQELAAPQSPQAIAKLIEPMREVLRISDRQHVAWDAAKAALTALEAELAQQQGSAT